MKPAALLAAVLLGSAITPLSTRAAEILIINGNGSSSIAAPLQAAGFDIVSAAYNPGVIADNLAAHPAITEVWIWNDGTFGNTGSPEQPSRAFNAADQAALTTFNASHPNWIMDGLSWRGNGNSSEQNLTANEGVQLATVGGGIVLGADDVSGPAIVQHVNQVAQWFNFDLFSGVYLTPPGDQHTGGTFFSSPNPVDPTQVVGTTTYSEVPNGLQPNGLFLGTAVFGSGTALQGYTPTPVPDLPAQVFEGVTYEHVNHLVTTTIPGASIDKPVPDGGTTFVLFGLSFLAVLAYDNVRCKRDR